MIQKKKEKCESIKEDPVIVYKTEREKNKFNLYTCPLSFSNLPFRMVFSFYILSVSSMKTKHFIWILNSLLKSSNYAKRSHFLFLNLIRLIFTYQLNEKLFQTLSFSWKSKSLELKYKITVENEIKFTNQLCIEIKIKKKLEWRKKWKIMKILIYLFYFY